MYYCNEKFENHEGDIEPDAYMEFTLALAESFLTDRFLTARVWKSKCVETNTNKNDMHVTKLNMLG